MRRLAEFPEAELLLERIKAVASAPLGAPGLVEVSASDEKSFQDELDPNLVAEYLDQHLSREDERDFEAVCFSSDVFLAEVVCTSAILNTILGRPADTTSECRAKLYQIGHTTPIQLKLVQDEPEAEPRDVEIPTVVSHEDAPEPLHSYKTTASEKKRVRESLDEWKHKRSNRLKIVIILAMFLAVGVCAWRYKGQIQHFDFNGNKSQTVTTESQLENAPLFEETIDPADWENSPDNYLYYELERPEIVLMNADPDLAPPGVSRTVAEPYRKNFDTAQVSGTAPQDNRPEPTERRKPPILYGQLGSEDE